MSPWLVGKLRFFLFGQDDLTGGGVEFIFTRLRQPSLVPAIFSLGEKLIMLISLSFFLFLFLFQPFRARETRDGSNHAF